MKEDEELKEEFNEESLNKNIESVKELDVNDERNSEKVNTNYDSENIEVLDGLEAVRLRPGMYIGTTSSEGLHHLVWEIVDNAIDEVLAGACDVITVTLNAGGSVTVTDNGRGIPVNVVKKTGVSAVQTVFTVLHAGGKFGGNGGYKVSGGLHGVGAAVVNALSERLEVNVHRNGANYYMKFERGGKVSEPLKKIGDATDVGTTVTFKPDPLIFNETTEFNYEEIRKRLQQLAFLNKKLKIILTDNRGEVSKKDEYYYEGGIKEYVKFNNESKTPITNSIFYCEGKEEVTIKTQDPNNNKIGVYVEVSLQYNATFNTSIYPFCNNIFNPDQGTHVNGFRNAVNFVFNNYFKDKKIFKNENNSLKIEDIISGCVVIISVKHPNPQYEGQTKGKLGSSEVQRVVYDVVKKYLSEYLLENRDDARIISEKIKKCYDARIAAEKAREAIRGKTGLELTTLPGKLADCESNDPTLCELFIVEGNSAGGSAKYGRDKKIQAILPLRGKILNVEKCDQKSAFDNAEIGNMINAIGGGIDPEFDVSKIRYNKVVIMTDADVDGSHIRILLLTFFFRFMKNLITDGHVFIAQPPLYKIEYHQKLYYAYNDAQLEEIKKTLQLKSGYPFQRYKGLGEMNPEQLFETTMNPNNRKMLKVTIKDAIEADKIFSDLMGGDVPPRKEFISKNAVFVKNLDI